MRVCVLGLGTMGLPMALRLEELGFEVAGWDVLGAAGRALERRAPSLDAAVAGASLVLTMLPQGEDVAEAHRAIRALEGPRRILIDSSTIDVETTRRLAAQAAEAGHGFVDAPVSGGAEGARAGTLSFMVGGEAADIEAARPVLDALGGKIQHFGPAGAGQAAKACHNMICGITALGVCEAFALAEALGLEQQAFFDLCSSAAAQSWILENRCPVPGLAPNAPASKGYAPGFAARLMAKDLRLAQAAAEASGQETPFGAEAARRFTEHAEAAGDLDFSSIYRTIRKA